MSFTAEYDLAESFSDGGSAHYTITDGTVIWQLSGTNSSGCSVEGSGSARAFGQLTVYGDLQEYGHTLDSDNTQNTGSVTTDCGNGPTTEPDNPQILVETGPGQPYQPGQTELTGSHSYPHPGNPDVQVQWQWQLTAAS